ELVLPGSPLADVLEEGALGTLDHTFAAGGDHGAPGAVGGFDSLPGGGAGGPLGGRREWPPLVAVRDLELVADWAGALRLLASAPAEVWADVVVGGVAVPGDLRWWLGGDPGLDGQRAARVP